MLFKVKNTQVYLLASLHLLSREWEDLPKSIWDAYQKSEVCIFEDNIFQPIHPFPPMIKEDGSLYPWMQALFGTMAIAKELNLFPEYGFDSQLLKKSTEDQKTVIYLDEENSCNAFAASPFEEQELMLDITMNQPEKIKSLIEGIYSSWKEGNMISLAKLLEDQFRLFPEIYKHLVTARNHTWCPKIITIIKENAPAIITVGALHFLGTDGICQQIENHGYHLVKLSP